MAKVLGMIPARGGSKRVPGKNIRLLAGRPLLAWTILEAMKSAWLDDVIVSSENAEILDVAQQYGAGVIHRPLELARDESPMYGVILHALAMIPADYICLLQPTSPLRAVEDIDGCIIACGDEKACVSATEGTDVPNGAVYVGREDWLRGGGNFDTPGLLKYFMPQERSLDINIPEEFEEAERLMST